MALRQLEAVQAELHTPVDRLQPALAASDHVHQLSVPQLDAAVAPHVPQLRDLREGLGLGALHDLIRHLVPGGVQAGLGVHQVLGHHGGFGKLPKVEDDTLALRNDVEIPGEGVGELLQGMVGGRDRSVLQALLGDDLLPGLHTHLHVRDEGVVICSPHLSLLHHEPLAARPGLFLVAHLGPIKDAEHAKHRHGVLAQSQLLQEVVCLEHDIAGACSSQPGRLEDLLLGRVLEVLRVNRIQGKEGLSRRGFPHLQGQQEVFQVHRSRWLQRCRNTNGLRSLIQYQATKPLRSWAAAHALGQAGIGRNAVHPPADVVFPAVFQLLVVLPRSAMLLLALGFLHENLCHALCVDASILALATLVGKLANRQGATGAEWDFFPIGIHLSEVDLCQTFLGRPVAQRSLQRLGGQLLPLRRLSGEPWERLPAVAWVGAIPAFPKLLRVLAEGVLLVVSQAFCRN
mmetsp:Transcript_58318/g.138827  ORF Transcript_58318/g.138827 Transcript_58318/m.138827 type:complete len:458 (-) Transcript_58318:270-1643(-)